MIRAGIYQKAYIIIAFVLMAFIYLGYMMSNLIRDYAFPSFRNPQAAFFARLVDQVNQSQRKEALNQIQNWAGPSLPFDLALIDSHGKVIYPPGLEIAWRSDWSKLTKPREDYESIPVDGSGARSGNARPTLVKFPGEADQYLYVYFDRLRRPGTPPRLVIWTLGGVVISILIGIAVSLIFLSRTLRTKIELADSVLAELQKGNLKARFPIKAMDEIGQAMTRFNNMADEIERLVEQIRSADKSRMALLQELTHDLRTPIASMKNLLETLNSGKPLSDPVRGELTSLATTEIHYFERLIEDLLLLAQVSDPKYLLVHESIVLNELIEEEAETIASQIGNQSIRLSLNMGSQIIAVQGDALLIKRLLRNMINNAFSYARQEVRVTLDISEGKWARLAVTDDGPGFSDAAIESFGIRRSSRILDKKSGGRLSVGLGSVIMKNITYLHRGSIKPSNKKENGKILGAEVTVLLPLPNEQSLSSNHS